jgi:Multicopper oxidase
LALPPDNRKGEWHMHCHLLDHMKNDGMMGSLLITAAGDPLDLPKGTISMGMPMPPMPMGGMDTGEMKTGNAKGS